MKLTLDITQADIDNAASAIRAGLRRGNYCPIAGALLRITGQPWNVLPDTLEHRNDRVILCSSLGSVAVECAALTHLMQQFDAATAPIPVSLVLPQPASFTLELPDTLWSQHECQAA